MKTQRNLWIAGSSVFLLSFILLFAGAHFALGESVELQNFIAFAVLSIIFAALAVVLYAFKMKAAFFIFLAGLIVGFTLMLAQFFKGMDGWEGIIGLLALFLSAGIGLAGGLLIQLIWFLYQRYKAKTRCS